MTRKQFQWALVWTLLVVVGLPAGGNWYRRKRLPECALDGAAIEPIYAVEIVDSQKNLRRFCCIRCAEYWLAQQTAPVRDVRVTDEVTGAAVEAAAAFFVRSTIVTNHATGNNVHAFRTQHDAEEHAAANRGRLLRDSERPLATTGERTASVP